MKKMKKLLLLSISSFFLVNCNNTAVVNIKDSLKSNPMAQQWSDKTADFGGVPQFDKMNPELVKEAMLSGMEISLMDIDKIANNTVKCISKGKDQYKRTLAECFVNNDSLSSYLVRSGYAFAYRRYSDKFISDEDYARVNKIGMWSMKFDYPWDYRRNN